MNTRCGELVATDEPTVVAKPVLDSIVVENGQGDGRFSNSASTNKSDRNKVLSQIDYLFDQLITSEEGPRRQRRGFSRYARSKRKIVGIFVA